MPTLGVFAKAVKVSGLWHDAHEVWLPEPMHIPNDEYVGRSFPFGRVTAYTESTEAQNLSPYTHVWIYPTGPRNIFGGLARRIFGRKLLAELRSVPPFCFKEVVVTDEEYAAIKTKLQKLFDRA